MKLEDLMKKKNLSEEEVKNIIKKSGYSKPEMGNIRPLPYNDKRVKFVIASDFHMGHKNFRPDILDHAIRNANRQKYLNSISGGQKPDIIAEGHYHKAMYMFYRNVHFFESGALQDQTIFMKKKQTPSMTGYWIIDAWANKHGVDKIKSEFVPFFQ